MIELYGFLGYFVGLLLATAAVKFFFGEFKLDSDRWGNREFGPTSIFAIIMYPVTLPLYLLFTLPSTVFKYTPSLTELREAKAAKVLELSKPPVDGLEAEFNAGAMIT